jgi:hypothetical protein
MRFHCIQVNIISFTNTRKVLSSIFRYSRINKYLSDFHADLLHGITLKIERTSGNVGRSFCMLFCKVRGILYRYSHNPQTFNKSFEYLCTEYFPNCNETVHTRKKFLYPLKSNMAFTEPLFTTLILFNGNIRRLSVQHFTHTVKNMWNADLSSFGRFSRPWLN